jgi:DNA-binding SARP family transcriptional activator
VSNLIRSAVGGGGARAAARDRLLRALGQPTLGSLPAEAGVGPALSRLAAALDLSGLTVVGTEGAAIASVGTPVGAGSVPPVPLRAGAHVLGELRVGQAANGAALTARDEELVHLSAAYVAAALLTGRREDEQISQLTQLAQERADVESRAEQLHAALVEHRDRQGDLRVHALGPLRVERDGQPIERWGGDKAGTRQAQGLFAFLYDRGEHGVAKDEAIDLLWPDSDLERADLAFHRTLGGLRSTLDPGRAGAGGRAIRFVNDRYRLEASIVEWSDVGAFLAALDGARDEENPRLAVRQLELARRLYRGDYLDDCPYYGDSVHVEPRRAELRSRAVDLAIALGERYEQSGDRMSAAAAFREAIERSPTTCLPAESGLARLGF